MKRIALTLSLLALATPAFAVDTDSDAMDISATVSTQCTIVADPMSFSSDYDTITGAELAGQADLTVACTTGTTAMVTLNEGLNDDGGTAAAPARRLASAADDYLDYQLYTGSGLGAAVWGSDALSGVEYEALSSEEDVLTVYAKIASGQDVPAGEYTDSVQATITF